MSLNKNKNAERTSRKSCNCYNLRKTSREESKDNARRQCQLEKRVAANLSPQARQDLYTQKREAQLHRILLPDAPPRKRKTKHQSPERSPCIVVGKKESIIGNENRDGLLVPEPGPSNHDGSKLMTDSEFICPDLPSSGPAPESSGDSINNTEPKLDDAGGNPITIEFIYDPDPPAVASSVLSDGDVVLEETIVGWLAEQQNSDDEDLNVDNHARIITRTVTDEQADDTGLSCQQVEILQRDAEASDRHLHDVVPSDDYFDFQWTNDPTAFKGQRETFTARQGPTKTVSDKEVDVFYDMFDEDFIKLLVDETNRYAHNILTVVRNNPARSKYTRSLKWIPTDRDEMVTFLAIIILQGLYPKPREEAYFTFDGFGTMPFFAMTMTFNRFYLLKTFLHFTDNENLTDKTKLRKIRPVINYFNDKFASLYTLGQEIALDESLLKWNGRLGFSQKIATKAARIGVKTYELCESSSGYLWGLRVYTGRDGPVNQPDGQTEHHTDTQTDRPTTGQTDDEEGCTMAHNATSKIVHELIKPLLNRGHTLVMDNFYNSPLLARCLKRQKTDVYGTLRLSREFVPDSLKRLTKADFRQGEAVASFCKDLSVMVWRDSNLVSMISTYHHLEVGTKRKQNRETYKPTIVLDYNQSMGGVDKKDQFLASQPMERTRCKIWYKKLFRRLFNDAIHNCFVIYVAGNPGRKITQRSFRTKLAEDLLIIHRRVDIKENRLTIKRPTRPTLSVKPTVTLTQNQKDRPYVRDNHFPTLTGSKYTRCWICANKKKPSRTAYKCEQCDKNLCIIGCFKEYHKPPR